MHLRKVTLFNFKNYSKASFDFSEGINCIVGDNGSGKTNLLDSIYYLCLTKSAFQNSDSLIVRDGESSASVKGEFYKSTENFSVHCKFGESIRKSISCNGEEYEKFSDHIGRFTSVLVHPHDVDYVRMGSDMRRKLWDGAISQVDHKYLENILKYNRLIKQRNIALKTMRERGSFNEALLETYDNQIFQVAPYIIETREKTTREIVPGLNELYSRLSDDKEKVDLQYQPSCSKENIQKTFQESRRRDMEAARTLHGPHRDEYSFIIKGKELKAYGSQGQQKSYILSLKLSFLSLLKDEPLLLLDDIFDRLDSGRIERLMKLIVEMGFQSFITDARPERVESLLEDLGIKARLLYI